MMVLFLHGACFPITAVPSQGRVFSTARQSCPRWRDSTACITMSAVMTPLAKTHVMQCAPVPGNLVPPTIELDHTVDMFVSAIPDRLLKIAGVSQAHVDPWHSTIHVLYDGGPETVKTIHHFLVTAVWGNRTCEGDSNEGNG